MKKSAIAIAILCITTTFSAYAETTTGPTTYTITTSESKQPAKADTKPADQSTDKGSNSSGSVYDSIRSGWNRFIDVLTGTKDPGK